MFNNILKNYIKYLLWMVPSLIKKVYVGSSNHIELVTTPNKLKFLSIFLKNHWSFNFSQLVDIVAVDLNKSKKRFSIFYFLLSVNKNTRICMQINVFENSLVVPTLIDVFESAAWSEREVWDMFGIFFKNNYDLRRILTDYGFNFNPLRKDFPLTGFTEVFYNNANHKISYRPVKLDQEYRFFETITPWKNF